MDTIVGLPIILVTKIPATLDHFEIKSSTYILLDVLLCSIAEYFYELCRILASP